ncbi:GL23453 [Drosophila persimilis]|uniref:GL23453 n=1 Tax=Drosophila persimilis TaxID=7234 RepID=B4HD38_DROPE|nr:GL23453 [Drosophila persimilis]
MDNPQIVKINQIIIQSKDTTTGLRKSLAEHLCSSVRDGSTQRQSQYSTKTTSSSVANLSLQEKPSVEKPLHFKPGIGEDYCWFDVRLWGILVYYYAPIVLLLIFSIVCCLKAYFSIYELPPDTQYILGTQLRIVKTHFYAFCAYLVGVFAVWLREVVVYIMARVREHFFIIDFWSGICILGLAIAGFILLLGKNMHVKSWWAINVESSQTDLSVINARVYNFNEKGDLKSSDSPYQPTVTSL